MDEKLISCISISTSASAESTAQELFRKAVQLYQKALELDKQSKLQNEVDVLAEKMRLKDEQIAFVQQERVRDAQVSDALSAAMDVLSQSQPATSVPLSEKTLLTVKEAAAYTGLGEKKLRAISDSEKCNFVLRNGSKRLFKRRLLDAYLVNREYSI